MFYVVITIDYININSTYSGECYVPFRGHDHYLTCLIFPLRWACFSIKTSRIAQWVHIFSITFNKGFYHNFFFFFDDNFHPITLWVSALRPTLVLQNKDSYKILLQ